MTKKLINDEKIDFVSRISVFIEISYEFYLNYLLLYRISHVFRVLNR